MTQIKPWYFQKCIRYTLPCVLRVLELENRHKLLRSLKKRIYKNERHKWYCCKGSEEKKQSSAFLFPLLIYMYLGNVQATKTGLYGSSYSCQEEASFFSKYIIKKPTFPQLFVCNHKQKKPGVFTQCPGFSAALLNLVNQRVKLRPVWKLRGKQPSNDQDIGECRMMLLLQRCSSPTPGSRH